MPLHAAFENQEAQFAHAFAIVRKAIEQRAFPGAALAATHNGALVASQGFGRFTYDDDSPSVGAETIFDVASLTKVLATSAIAMLLYERGRLSLDEPLATTLPEFLTLAPQDQRAWRAGVTLRMLLAHSSGMPAYEKLFQRASSREELLRGALMTPLVSEPGTRAEYSEIVFILLGDVLERKAGASLEAYARAEIFQPLRMSNTFFKPGQALRGQIPPTEDDRNFRKRVIQGEVNDENAYVMGGVAGHAGLFAQATDVAQFAECMLHGGAPLFKQETVQMFTRREPSPPGTTRALGWDTPSRPKSSSGRFFSESSYGHLGFTGTSLWIDPERKLSVTFLTNRTWPDRKSLLIREVRPLVHDAIVEALGE